MSNWRIHIRLGGFSFGTKEKGGWYFYRRFKNAFAVVLIHGDPYFPESLEP